MSNTKLFALVTVLTTCATLEVVYIHRPGPQPKQTPVSEDFGIYVSSQPSLRYVRSLTHYSIGTIVDMRPDGEALDEPSHLEMEQIAKERGIEFSYIPVPHESIPPATVTALGDILTSSEKPVLLYCRTGRRAVRTFALVEASRGGGPSADTIIAMVQHAGFFAEDLRPEIVSRIAGRATTPETKP